MRCPEFFQTARLAVTRMSHEDLSDWTRLLRDPNVAATLGGVRSTEAIHTGFMRQVRHWLTHGFGYWILRRADREFVGVAGLSRVAVTGTAEVELSYGLLKRFWGRGLAVEAGREILRLGFEGSERIVSYTLIHNARSRRVMEKLGFRYEREIRHAGLPHALYEADRRFLER